MSIEAYHEVEEKFWVVIPCRGAGDQAVTAWVDEHDRVRFARGGSNHHRHSSMEVPRRLLVRVLLRTLQYAGMHELRGNGRFVAAQNTISHHTSCGEARTFAYEDLDAFYDWLVQD